MEEIQDLALDVVDKWLNGILTKEYAMQVHDDIEKIINDGNDGTWKYFKTAEVGDTWRELIRRGLLESTPYAKGALLYSTLHLLEGQQIPLRLAHKMILHVW